jgi:hypothetical protein
LRGERERERELEWKTEWKGERKKIGDVEVGGDQDEDGRGDCIYSCLVGPQGLHYD